MPNIASVIKEEIVRLARKEIRNETESLKKASAIYRSEIAALKRRLLALEKQASRAALPAAGKAEAAAANEASERIRFSAKGLCSLRARLDLSAADFGRLLGVSPQTIYNWEAEKTRPRAGQVSAIAGLRSISKREASARLKAVPSASQ